MDIPSCASCARRVSLWASLLLFWPVFSILGLLSGPVSAVSAAPAAISFPTPPADPGAPEYLRATPDANSLDPEIVAQAAALGHDPARILTFVRDQIAFEAYRGSLRGARGTLWSRAGNALDKASLTLALLRASNVPARYATGTLADAEAKALVRSLFKLPQSVVGCPPDGALRADPESEAGLLDEVREHFWVEYAAGGGFQSADPSLAGLAPGQAAAVFAEIPDALRHRATVRLVRELTSQLADRFSGGQGADTRTVLEQSFAAAELAGKPLTAGHFVNSSTGGALFLTVTTHTYSPYLLIGQGDGDMTDDPLLRGEDYQEVYSNFPLANNVLTGVFLEIDLTAPGGAVQTYRRTLADRIGFAVRTQGGSASLGPASGSGPLLDPMDLATVHVLPGLQAKTALAPQQQRLANLQTRWQALEPARSAIPASGPTDTAQAATLAEAAGLARNMAVVTAENAGIVFALAADASSEQLQKGYLTKAYAAFPRVVVATAASGEDGLRFGLDVLKNDLRTLAFPGQVASTPLWFEIMRGLMESSLEGEVLAALTGQSAVSIPDVFKAMGDSNSLRLLAPENPEEADTLAVSAEARARITAALAAGRTVLTPTDPVTVGGRSTVGWLETDWTTGHTISVMEDGSHGGIVEGVFTYAKVLNSPLNIAVSTFAGTLNGMGAVQYQFMAELIGGIAANDPLPLIVKRAKVRIVQDIVDVYAKKFFSASLDLAGTSKLGKAALKCFMGFAVGKNEGLPGVGKCFNEAASDNLKGAITGDTYKAYEGGMIAGMAMGVAWISYNFPGDPPVFPFLSGPLAAGPGGVTPGAGAGVGVGVVRDELFTVSFGEVELPTVFKAQVRNTGPEADTYELSFPAVPAGFSAQSSLSKVTVAPGATAEVGVCLNPALGAPAPPGTELPFTLRAASLGHPGVAATGGATVAVPTLHGLSLDLGPARASLVPGASLATTLSVTASGNVAETVELAASVPAGLSLTGLPARVALAPGESRRFPLTAQFDAGAATNQDLSLAIAGTLAGTNPAVRQSARLQVAVRAAAAVALDQALLVAEGGSNGQLPVALAAFRDVLDGLASNPDDARLWDRARLLSAELRQVAAADPLLVPHLAQLDRLAAEVSGKRLAGVQGLAGSLFTDLAEASAQGIAVALAPNASLTPPGTETTLQLKLKNRGSRPASLSLSLVGLPADVQALVPVSPVALAAGAELSLPIRLTPANAGRFPFRASVAVAGFERPVQASGLVVGVSGAVNILSLSGTPPFILKNGTSQVRALIANASGLPLDLKATLSVWNPDGTLRYRGSQPVPLHIPDGDTTIPYELGSVTADGWPDGNYRLQVDLTDAAGQPLNGGQGRGNLGVGLPLRAAILANPVQVPPGDSEVVTAISVTPVATGSSGVVGLEPTDTHVDRIDWAAASRGATLQVVNPGATNGQLARLLDEIVRDEGRDPEFYIGLRFKLGGYLQVDLGQVRTIDTVRFRLWDGDNRYSQYKLEASLDNQTFFTLADRTSGEHRSIQTLAFTPTAMRYIRITGTFDSRDGTDFFLTDEIIAIGDGPAVPVATQTVTLETPTHTGSTSTVGKKLTLNAGVYEVRHVSGAISYWPNDTDHYGQTWMYSFRTRIALAWKDYYDTGEGLFSETQAKAETAAAGRSFRLVVPVHSDVTFWINDLFPGDNRGSETFEIRQVSGPSDTLPQRVRDALSRAVQWEQPETGLWNDWAYKADYNCYGCHIQAQASTGIVAARQKLSDLPVDPKLEDRFLAGYLYYQNPETGAMPDDDHLTEGSLWAWAVSHYAGLEFDRLAHRFVQTLDWLLGLRLADGSFGFSRDDRAKDIYIDADYTQPATTNATHTAGNIEALAKALTYLAGKDLVPMADEEAAYTGGQAEFGRNPGRTSDLMFTPVQNVTAIRITVTDTFFGQGLFVLNELEAFQGSTPRPFAGTDASFSQNGFGIAGSIDGKKNEQYNGWAIWPKDSRKDLIQGVWTFAGPVSLDRLRLTQIWPAAQIKKLKLEFTSDPNPGLNSSYVEAAGLRAGLYTADRTGPYLEALTRAARALAADSFAYTRNIRTTAQTLIGLQAALPFLTGADAAAARARIAAADRFLREQQREDGGWQDAPGGIGPSTALPSAEALEALLTNSRNSIDPAILKGAEYLLATQKEDGSWAPPEGVVRRLASTTWVQIALPTIFRNLSALTVAVDHRIPAAGVTPVAGSYNPDPASTSSGGNETRLHWDDLLDSDLTRGYAFAAKVTGMQPGEVRQIGSGSTVSFASVAGSGSIELQPVVVSARHILGLAPAERSARGGETVGFELKLENPLAVPTRFDFSATGLPEGSFELPGPVSLAPGEKRNIAFAVRVPQASLAGDLAFSLGISNGGLRDFAASVIHIQEGDLTPAAPVALIGHALNLALAPPAATAGQGTPARFRVRLTNVGSEAAGFNLAAGLPTGFTARFGANPVRVPPGNGNAVEVDLEVIPPSGTAAGDYPLLVAATSATAAGVRADAAGTVRVAGQGVSLAFNPVAGLPDTALSLRVTNTGQVADSFDLSLGGPAALDAILAATSLTLNPGAYADVAVRLGGFEGLLAGGLELVAEARSQSEPAVSGVARATVGVAAAQVLEAGLEPSSLTLPTPGAARLVLVVHNRGSGEDAYRVSIVSTQGPLAAGLENPAGGTVQTLAEVRLPAGADGVVGLSAALQAAGSGSVAVRVESLTNPAVQATATAKLSTDDRTPVAVTGPDQYALVGAEAVVDGSASSDPGHGTLAFAWSFDQVPAGSRLRDADLADRTTPKARFVPDIAGTFRLKLVVDNGTMASAPVYANLIAVAGTNVPPNADAGRDRNAVTGVPVALDGSNSRDPDLGPAPLSHRWTLLSAPAGSLSGLNPADRATAEFTPDLPGDYRLELRVFDGLTATSAVVKIAAYLPGSPEIAPVADAGPDRSVGLDQPVALDGSASVGRLPGLALRYTWHFVTVPAGSQLKDADLKPTQPDGLSPRASFVPDVPGIYLLRLEVSDGMAIAADNLLITVTLRTVTDVCDTTQTANPDARGRYKGTAGDDAYMGTNRPDRMLGRRGNDRLYGGDGNDKLFGAGGNDLLCGMAGSDKLLGLGGNDTLSGGPGPDRLAGGGGADLYHFEALSSGDDQILGFDRRDTLLLRDTNGDGVADRQDVTLVDSGRGALVSFRDGSGDRVLIRGIKLKRIGFKAGTDGKGESIVRK